MNQSLIFTLKDWVDNDYPAELPERAEPAEPAEYNPNLN